MPIICHFRDRKVLLIMSLAHKAYRTSARDTSTLYRPNCKGAPVPAKDSTSKTWLFCSACKNLGAQHVFGPYFGGRALEILEFYYKTEPTFDHDAKFHDDRPTELRDLVAKKKKKKRKK